MSIFESPLITIISAEFLQPNLVKWRIPLTGTAEPIYTAQSHFPASKGKKLFENALTMMYCELG